MGAHELARLSAAVSSGYALSAVVLLAGLAIFRLGHLIENPDSGQPDPDCPDCGGRLALWPHLDETGFVALSGCWY